MMAGRARSIIDERKETEPLIALDRDEDAATWIRRNPRRSWKSHIWDTFDKSPEERRFLFKLDVALMTLASLGYFIKAMDQVYHLQSL